MKSRDDINVPDEKDWQDFDDGEYPVSLTKQTPRGVLEGDDYRESFSALKESVFQGRDLKKKRKALEEYNKTLATLKDAYADRLSIAANYDAIINDQEHIISATNVDMDNVSNTLAGIDKKISSANDALAQLKREQAKQRKPLEEELDLRNAELASAKDELKQVKAQRESLELFEAGSEQAAASEAAHDAVIERVNQKLDAAKAAQRDAQKAVDAREKEERAKVKKSLDAIKQLNGEKDKVNERMLKLEKRLAAAHERIAFCNHVIEHPEETEAMHMRIAENERTAAEMSSQIESLASSHAVSKAASAKARMILIAALVVVVVIIVIVFFVMNR